MLVNIPVYIVANDLETDNPHFTYKCSGTLQAIITSQDFSYLPQTFTENMVYVYYIYNIYTPVYLAGYTLF